MIEEKKMTIKVDQTLGTRKDDLLSYFRSRGAESLQLVIRKYSEQEYKKRAKAINKAVAATKNNVLKNIEQAARKDKWNNSTLLRCILMTRYASDISMLELRNKVWPYEYMAFSRRIGEIWEPFCKLCFEYPQTDIRLFVPPLFSEVRKSMVEEIETYINELPLNDKQKPELTKYYNKIWALVTSGEIKLELDLHFEHADNKFNVDFKSGFGSNEKGNTNRLLLVATIYKNIEQNYQCVLLVRSEEQQNNHYFQTLKKSGLWEAYSGKDTYKKIRDYTGFDLKEWIDNNINWASDLEPEMVSYLQRNNLTPYLVW